MNISAQGMQDVSVKVPDERIGEFYEMYGRWLQGETAFDTDDVERSPWDPKTDHDLAKEAWQVFPHRAQLVFTTLIENPGKKFSGDDLAEMHNIPNGRMGLAGVLAWPGRNLYKLRRVLPITVKPNPAGGSWYSMEPDVAELFKQASDTS